MNENMKSQIENIMKIKLSFSSSFPEMEESILTETLVIQQITKDFLVTLINVKSNLNVLKIVTLLNHSSFVLK